MNSQNVLVSSLADFIITLATNYSVQRKFDEYQNDKDGLRQYLISEFQLLDTADINVIVAAQQQPADSDPYKALAQRTQTSFEAWNVK